KTVKAVVQHHDLSVLNISNEKLIQILQYLLREGVFSSNNIARTIFPELFQPITPPGQEVPKPPSQQTSIMQEFIFDELFTTGIYSDLTLISTERTYAAHRVVVCFQSPVISKSCKHQDANRDKSGDCSTHTPTNSFNFLDDDPLSVDCIVQFFYRSDYNIARSAPGPNAEIGIIQKDEAPNSLSENNGANDSDLVLHVKVYALAEKYDIPVLKALSLGKFKAAALQHWRSPYLLDALRKAYTSTIEEDRGMRTAGVKILHTRRELLEEENVRQLLKELPQLAYDQLMYLNDMTKPNQTKPNQTKPKTNPLAFRG
ncbi:hypothetical protein EDB80DRAFT_593534, partial [Ilyonectria destructans]